MEFRTGDWSLVAKRFLRSSAQKLARSKSAVWLATYDGRLPYGVDLMRSLPREAVAHAPQILLGAANVRFELTDTLRDQTP